MFDESNGADRLSPLPPTPLYIIMDFAIVSGMDTSAVDLLRETITLCKNNRCQLFLSGMSPTLRSNLVYAGIKPDGKTFSFQPDLETSIGKAEDGLLTNVFHLVKQDEQDAGVRRRARAVSVVDNGFLYALKKIDEQVRKRIGRQSDGCLFDYRIIVVDNSFFFPTKQHGLSYAAELEKLEMYTKVVELQPGEPLFLEEGGSVEEADRGFFFIEHGLIKIERNFAYRTTRSRLSQPHEDSCASIGHLHARGSTVGRQDAMMKEVRKSERGLQPVQNFRLARIGKGWIVGSIEGCSGMRNMGMHFAGKRLCCDDRYMTACWLTNRFSF